MSGPPTERMKPIDERKRSGVRQALGERATQHYRAVVATGGTPRAWAGRIAGGGAIAGSGAALLYYVERVPWYVGALLIAAGLQIASNGALFRSLLVLKEAVIDIIRANKGQPVP